MLMRHAEDRRGPERGQEENGAHDSSERNQCVLSQGRPSAEGQIRETMAIMGSIWDT